MKVFSDFVINCSNIDDFVQFKHFFENLTKKQYNKFFKGAKVERVILKHLNKTHTLYLKNK